MTNMKKFILVTFIALTTLYSSNSYGDTSKITIHPGGGVDNISLGDTLSLTSKTLGKHLFFEETTGKGAVETRFYSYKNSVLAVSLSLTKSKYKQYKKLHQSAKSNFIESHGTVSKIKIIPLLGNISIRGSITSKSSLNDVLTTFGPLNIKLTVDGQTVKCFTSTIDPSPFNSNEHIMTIHYLSDGIKFEFLIADSTMLTTITIGTIGKCIVTTDLETF